MPNTGVLDKPSRMRQIPGFSLVALAGLRLDKALGNATKGTCGVEARRRRHPWRIVRARRRGHQGAVSSRDAFDFQMSDELRDKDRLCTRQ
jgi:hypothetical protein